jgi:hypothetical protein
MHRVTKDYLQYIFAADKMTSNSTGVLLLPDEEKFNGTGYSGFKTKIVALAKACGWGGYMTARFSVYLNPLLE